ncbi:MAG: dihydrolipoyllysine-residue acetyltransferase [Rhodocyclaceae bacterium]|nr:dihydrolipoyllysine-residue acetyltransferase [Rhodocyclaceae bacterium]
MIEIRVPDIGDFKDVPVIEVLVQAGDVVQAEDALVTLESDKATMDVPAPVAGKIVEVLVKVGDKVSEGTPIVRLLEDASQPPAREAAAPEPLATHTSVPPLVAAPSANAPTSQPPASAAQAPAGDFRPQEAEPTTLPPAVRLPTPAETVAALDGVKPHASPSVRRLARVLGVDLGRVVGSGPKGRILREDVEAYVKGIVTAQPAPAKPEATGFTLDLPPWPEVDFAKFGPIEARPLSRIQKISGPNLARNWVMIPAVTYHEESDVTELEAFRQQLNREHEKAGLKVTMLAFLIKAAVVALQKYPELNASLQGENLVLKRYWHIGFAADTPQGLVVPVLRDADKKGVLAIAEETAALAQRARAGKLSAAEMQGASFTISSLGGIGGTGFSPIVNAPEVAILGVSRAAMKPVWTGQEFSPRLMLPLSLTADHRVIDGALATRFLAFLAQLLADFRRVTL